jgi:hypothetical protein
MPKSKWSIAEMRETEVAHLRGKLRIAMAALEALAEAGDETAQRAMERIEGDE